MKSGGAKREVLGHINTTKLATEESAQDMHHGMDDEGHIPPHSWSRSTMLIRATRDECFVMLWNGLTLELSYGIGSTRGVWLLGERFLQEIVAGEA